MDTTSAKRAKSSSTKAVQSESQKGRTEPSTQPDLPHKAATASSSSSAINNDNINKYSTNPQFIFQLTHLKAEQLPLADRVIFICQRTDKVVDVWKGLIQHGFLSVPVLQKTKNKYYGFVDISDIVHFIVHHFGQTKLEGGGQPSTTDDSSNKSTTTNANDNTSATSGHVDFWELVKQEEGFQTKTVNDIMTYPLSKRNPFHPVTRGYSLFHVCELLAREHGLHRVPIVDEDRRLIHMITQSRLIQFLFNNLLLLGDVRNKPVSMIRSVQQDLITVKETDTAFHAFQIMSERNVSGLAVVHEDGRLMGSISLRDLKAIQSDATMFWRLFQTVTNFLRKIRNEKDPERPHTVISVKREDTLEVVLTRLHEHHIHRVFVVDQHRIPVGVVSLKDVLYELISS